MQDSLDIAIGAVEAVRVVNVGKPRYEVNVKSVQTWLLRLEKVLRRQGGAYRDVLGGQRDRCKVAWTSEKPR